MKNTAASSKKKLHLGRGVLRSAALTGAPAALWLGLAGSARAVPNPVLVPDRGSAADCGTMKFNGEYYIIGNTTSGDMFMSPDLVHWGNRTHVFSMHNDWVPADLATDRNINACEPSYYNGLFNLYWIIDQGSRGVVQIGHAVADTPLGPYHEPDTKNWFASKIDPHLFRDDDGSLTFFSVKFDSGNQIWAQPAQDPFTLIGEPRRLLTALPHTWEWLDDNVNEGPYVTKYRNRYYMIYNANHTGKGHYALGCAEADSPLGFTNAGKYVDPVVEKNFPAPGHLLTSPGQPTLIDGPNGFEKWLVYFLEVDGARRQQAIDRVFFFDQHLYVDGPTSAASPGYHPLPSQPEFQDLFSAPDGAALSGHWHPQSGKWTVQDKAAQQSQATGRDINLIAGPKATQYLAEVNVKLLDATSSDAGLIAYWKDSSNWMCVTLDGLHRTWNVRKMVKGTLGEVRTALSQDFNFQVWHSLRVTKNGANFEVRIDDRPAPGVASIPTKFNGVGLPGLLTDNARAGFDGFIYTIGWDETAGDFTNWGKGIGGKQRGAWSLTARGLVQSQPSGVSRIFKGDAAAQYEFTAQLTQDSPAAQENQLHTLGIMPVYVNDRNYLQADVDFVHNQLRVSGRKAGRELPVQTAPLPVRFPVPTGEQPGQMWRYTTEAPASNWATTDFNAGTWKTGASGFGGATPRTAWKSNEIWLRRDFDLQETPTDMTRLRLRLQGDAEVYLNGVLAMLGSGNSADYEMDEILDAAHATLKKGKNTIAIYVTKNGTVQGIDAGLFLSGIVDTPGSVNLRAVKLKDRVFLFVNGQQRMEIAGSWPDSQVGLTTDGLQGHFSGITQFRIGP